MEAPAQVVPAPAVAPAPPAAPQIRIADPYLMNGAPEVVLVPKPQGGLMAVQPPGAEQTPAATAPPAPAAATPETPAAPLAEATPVAPPNPIDAAINELLNPSAAPTFDDGFKSTFKQLTGSDDPLKYIDERRQRDTEFDLQKGDAEYGRGVKNVFSGIEQNSPAFHKALLMQMEGKSQTEIVSYLRSLPDPVLLNKESKELHPKQLVGTHLPGQMSDQEWTALETNNFEGFDEASLKYKADTLTKMAAHKQDTWVNEQRQSAQAADQQFQQRTQQRDKAIAATLTVAQQDPIARTYMTSADVEAIKTGQFGRGFLTQDDGVTPHPDMVKTIVRGLHFDEAVRRAYESGLTKGQQNGAQQQTAGMPTPSGGRAVTQTTTEDPRAFAEKQIREQANSWAPR